MAGDLLNATTPLDQFATKSAILNAPLRSEQVKNAAERLLDHRNGLFVFAAETAWADADPPALADANVAWLDDFYAAVFPKPPEHAYQNFPDPDLANWHGHTTGGPNPLSSARLMSVSR